MRETLNAAPRREVIHPSAETTKRCLTLVTLVIKLAAPLRSLQFRLTAALFIHSCIRFRSFVWSARPVCWRGAFRAGRRAPPPAGSPEGWRGTRGRRRGAARVFGMIREADGGVAVAFAPRGAGAARPARSGFVWFVCDEPESLILAQSERWRHA